MRLSYNFWIAYPYDDPSSVIYSSAKGLED